MLGSDRAIQDRAGRRIRYRQVDGWGESSARGSSAEPVNFLAHLLLAENDGEARVGQVLADFVDAKSIDTFSEGIQSGIRAHQRIDAFSDRHPTFASARRRLRPPYRRYGGILLDVYFDHFLASAWQLHGNGTRLEDFAESCYRTLHIYRDLPPERFRIAVDAMRRDDWLVGYASLEGVDMALRGIARRCRHENPLDAGARVLEANYEAFRSAFEIFFPRLKAYASGMHAAEQPGRLHCGPATALERSEALPAAPR